jgi:hypothetical protein
MSVRDDHYPHKKPPYNEPLRFISKSPQQHKTLRSSSLQAAARHPFFEEKHSQSDREIEKCCAFCDQKYAKSD